MKFILRWQTRKPYTITKQRERWTEDEHNRFLEALKLYGRAWQRIEGRHSFVATLLLILSVTGTLTNFKTTSCFRLITRFLM